MLETYLHEQMPVDQRFYREAVPAHTHYHIRGIRSSDPTLTLPKRMPIETGTIPCLFFLYVQQLEKTKPIAMLGFEPTKETVTCKEIHGCKGEFHALKPVSWDIALLQHFVDTARKAGYKSAHVFPSSKITMLITTGSDELTAQRLRKRYDQNATYLGFTYDPEINEFVLPL